MPHTQSGLIDGSVGLPPRSGNMPADDPAGRRDYRERAAGRPGKPGASPRADARAVVSASQFLRHWF
jgi:hypothetical protein